MNSGWMAGQRYGLVLTVAFALVATGPGRALAQEKPAATSTVEVTGRGGTRWTAQADAVRQALQQTMAQLVIADRAVSDTEVLKDEVATTMNGFVQQLQVLDERHQAAEWELRCRVTVAPTAIANYIARGAAAGQATIDGNSMLGAALASSERRGANTKILQRMFSGISASVMQVRVKDIVAVPEQDAVKVTAEFNVDSAFINHIRQVGNALAKTFKKGPYQASNMVYVRGSPVLKLDLVDDDWLETIDEDPGLLAVATEDLMVILTEHNTPRPFLGVRRSPPPWKVDARIDVRDQKSLLGRERYWEVVLPTRFFANAKDVRVEILRPEALGLLNDKEEALENPRAVSMPYYGITTGESLGNWAWLHLVFPRTLSLNGSTWERVPSAGATAMMGKAITGVFYTRRK